MVKLRIDSEKKLHKFIQSRICYLSLIIIFCISAVPASAAVSELHVSPQNPVVGDTIKISGTASPGEAVNVEVSFNANVAAESGNYLYRISGVKIPSGSNMFTVTANGVESLNVRLKMLIWWTRSTGASGGSATISQGNVPSGTYDTQIDGTAAAGVSTVSLLIKASRTINADSTGYFEYSYTTGSIPAGDFEINAGGLKKTVTLAEGSISKSSGNSGGGISLISSEGHSNILLSETERRYVIKDSDISYYFYYDGNIVRYINFTGKANSGLIPAMVEVLKDTSTLVDSDPPDVIYRSFNVWVGNKGWATLDRISDPTILFSADREWVAGNNIDVSTIRLMHYSNGIWYPMTTIQTGEDEYRLYFEAGIPEFSHFAVTGKTMQEDTSITQTSTRIPPVQNGTETSGRKIPGQRLLEGISGLLIAVLFAIRIKHQRN